MGVDYNDACRTIQRAYESDWLILEGVYSHLACADNRDHPTNIKQKIDLIVLSNLLKDYLKILFVICLILMVSWVKRNLL